MIRQAGYHRFGLSLSLTGCLICSSLSIGAPCSAPSWMVGQSRQKSGTSLTVRCFGDGASQDIARMAASETCSSIASDYVASQTISAKDLTIVGDKSTAFHREVERSWCVVGLECMTVNEYACDDSGVFKVWRLCSYDIGKARGGNETECRQQNKAPVSADKATGGISNRDQLGTIKQGMPAPGGSVYQQGQSVVLILNTVPRCDDLLVEGRFARKIDCNANPMRLTIKPGDEVVTVRAKGYLPKQVKLSSERSETSINVVLDIAE